jgi:hypothetical protein
MSNVGHSNLLPKTSILSNLKKFKLMSSSSLAVSTTLISTNSAYTPFQELLLGCLDWADGNRRAVKSHLQSLAGECCYSNKESEDFVRTCGGGKLDEMVVKVQKQVEAMLLFNGPVSHPGLFQEVAWLFGNKPFYARSVLRLSLTGKNGDLSGLVLEYYTSGMPSYDEAMQYHLPMDRSSGALRIRTVIQNLENGYYGYSRRRPSTAEISVQTDDESNSAPAEGSAITPAPSKVNKG